MRSFIAFAGLSKAPRVLVRRLGLAPLLRRLFRRGPLTEAVANGKNHGWAFAAESLISDAHRSPLSDPRLHEILRADSNLDLEIECLLTALRKVLLLAGREHADDPTIEETVVTIACQAFNNGYVWRVSEDERSALERLRLHVAEQTRTEREREWILVALLCMYGRPTQMLSQELDPARTAAHRSFRAFLEAYSGDRAQETLLRSSIESVGPISRAISAAIGDTYEAHPYPRWVQLREKRQVPDRRVLAELFTARELEFLDEPFRLLEAGCGTGYGVVQCAMSYPRAQITAVDLSLASLSYAALMAKRHAAQNARFLRMDLLDLPQLMETFDMVRCIGVLHHMESPLEGGRALVSRVRPGGIVHISLYSRTSRRELARLRDRYGLSPGASDDEVRDLRRRIIDEEPAAFDERIPLRADFFDLDRCRDLLFHPLEHTFTVPQIADLLSGLGLEFRGFERPEISRSHLWTRFPSAREWRDWEAWHEFEQRYPDAFGSLYQIYARKT